ncbi:similar to Saccharomyces cerevisiae YDR183W PLP1 Protein that interacts with CCT (chaperonin containing TCP-1) complex and has a role in actin and tubulin folding [Maudiozyma barnettii]|uniref:Similar to Saccharomyces cerevisiae YDR183W PLP1 Protein that interacts with CCT (Chaperonin containing TCP-1) complex and has a role in actin and tubulin folding n=1 Tax=Maudiozyma barnettii TaxID=61262 RepID=A0A8H2VF09_9SACH|nr:Plp1p [Kazachstania barnettii]CAB4253934.1 similar to Saccharomyces cerevisiae YDR183W PLP1 Protein that interacts with CCT (chaperonin containing TCP-1) complex and has a role in actin and tubulin folding [Kazachstania barnettii]CAD1781684.1 similar to Saccharomyces cerevisiae YDR183W PLP1 Protein that interacts with CCT (chaperonin containing TCP-1) complex and has a role in actin and tubulin folding [Kazachstania barnettii]
MSHQIDKFERQAFSRNNNTSSDHDSDESDIDIDQLMDELDNDEEIQNIVSKQREARLQQLSDHLKNVSKKTSEDENFGNLETIEDEAKLIKLTSSSSIPVIIHFQLPHFKKCQYMDQQLSKLARKYLNTKFIRTNVEDCAFLVDKLEIKVLPFVVGYINGLERTRIVGFSKLGTDPNSFELGALERYLLSERLIKSNTSGFLKSTKIKSNYESDSSLDL